MDTDPLYARAAAEGVVISVAVWSACWKINTGSSHLICAPYCLLDVFVGALIGQTDNGLFFF